MYLEDKLKFHGIQILIIISNIQNPLFFQFQKIKNFTLLISSILFIEILLTDLPLVQVMILIFEIVLILSTAHMHILLIVIKQIYYKKIQNKLIII